MATPVPEGYKPGDPLTFSGFGGVRNDVTKDKLSVSDLAAGNNVDIDNAGEVALRKGRRPLHPGTAHSVWSDGKQCLFVLDGALYRLLPDFSKVQIRGHLSLGRYLAYSAENGLVYWTNGDESGVIEGDASRPWGIAPPDMPALLSGAPGLLRPGRYQAVLTFLDPDGRESGGSLPGTVTLAGEGGIRVKLHADSRYAANLYLSPMDGDEIYLAAEIPAGIDDYVFSGSEQDLGRALDKRYLIACPGGHLAAWYSGRMYVANGNLIYPSAALGYELFDPYDVIDIDGSRINVFAPVDAGIFVGTENRVVFLQGNGPDDFQVKERSTGGAVFGSLAYAKGSEVLNGELFGDYDTPIFSTAEGLVAGTQDGQLIPLSGPRYKHAKASRAAATIRRDLGFQQYLAVFIP